ncbi:MAG: phosphomannomutase/phosphoglucomutase [Acidobacteria bacterium]|nr:phosphomannomutase/phosphoglucomutase [Acidobacteriota bacterium]
MNPEIFREYDIRGVADIDLASSVVTTLGSALGSYMKENGCKRITLGRDCRLSSTRLRNDLVAGLKSTGLTIVDIGVCPTPVLYFSLHTLKPDGGIMITGSHNPPEYNGFKVAVGKTTIYGEEIQKVRRIAEKGSFSRGEDLLEEYSVLPEYQQHLVSSFEIFTRPSKVVVDCGNGTASVAAGDVYRKLGCKVIDLFCGMDGHFPNHHPDPTVIENLQDLIRKVEEEEADLGIAFDGDADRIGVVDEKGNILFGDQLMIVYARDILASNPGATIIGEVKSSKTLYDDIEKRKGRGIMWKAGHSLIKAKMKEEKALFAGEMSGHMFFADRHYGYDDAIYAGARLLEILSRTGKRLSELMADVPRNFSTPEIRVDCPDRYKFQVVKELSEYFGRHYETITVDGVRVQLKDGWALVRASNTQPVLVLRFEAETADRLRQIRSMVEERLQEVMSRVAAASS